MVILVAPEKGRLATTKELLEILGFGTPLDMPDEQGTIYPNDNLAISPYPAGHSLLDEAEMTSIYFTTNADEFIGVVKKVETWATKTNATEVGDGAVILRITKGKCMIIYNSLSTIICITDA